MFVTTVLAGSSRDTAAPISRMAATHIIVLRRLTSITPITSITSIIGTERVVGPVGIEPTTKRL